MKKLLLPALLILGVNASAAEPHFFFDDIKTDQDVPYTAPPGQVSRLSMLEEMGRKHPMMSCEDTCPKVKGDAVQDTGCKLGALGATYFLTNRQLTTGRNSSFLWQAPNAALNIEPYAYMKELEAGVPCEKSRFIQKFPDRAPRPGEGTPPARRIDVCRAWDNYFQQAGEVSRKYHGTLQDLEGHAGLSAGRQAREEDREISRIQQLMWKAHTTGILHAYWQYGPEFERSANPETPKQEYEMWLAWNRIVGKLVPEMNFRSCAASADVVAHQLMPNCVRGTRRADGRRCIGEMPSEWSGLLNKFGLSILQNVLKTSDFSKGVASFAGAAGVVHCPPGVIEGASSSSL